jgi:hypothetical protein
MIQEHQLTPPPELVEQWLENTRSQDCIGAYPANYEQLICTQAARWGADQELEACCEWLSDGWGLPAASDNLCAARRPKPPSLKERALSELDVLENIGTCNSETIRRALEALPE